MQANQVEKMIETGLTGAQVQVKSDDGSHFNVVVVSESFIDQSTIKQHQMVYGCLGNSIESNAIHAISLQTYSPQEWDQLSKQQVS